MSTTYDDLDGVLGIGQDAEGAVFYLRVTAGELTYDRSGEAFDHIQVVLHRQGDAHDMFETDELDQLAAELRHGVLDWYGEHLTFRLPTPAERDLIHAATGWPQVLPKPR